MTTHSVSNDWLLVSHCYLAYPCAEGTPLGNELLARLKKMGIPVLSDFILDGLLLGFMDQEAFLRFWNESFDLLEEMNVIHRGGCAVEPDGSRNGLDLESPAGRLDYLLNVLALERSRKAFS